MDRKAVVAGLLPALMLYACDRAIAPPVEEVVSGATKASVATSEDTAAATPSRGDTQGAGVDDSYPALTPVPLAPEAERTEKGARNLLLSFARAIELEEFGQAWAMLSAGDRQKWPKAKFTRMFAGLSKVTVAAPTGTMEGACGSSYYTAPVTITANNAEGRPIRYQGEAVLRRVNDIDGATAAQLRWHFDRLTLDWTH